MYLYKFIDEYEHLIYIHKHKEILLLEDLKKFISNEKIFLNTYKIEILEFNNELDLYSTEKFFLNKYNPKFNEINYKFNSYDEKRYNIIKIIFLNNDKISVKSDNNFLDNIHIFVIIIGLIFSYLIYSQFS